MKKFTKLLSIYLLSIALVCIAFLGVAQVPFTPGNIVVTRVGNGTSSVSTLNTMETFLDEFTPSGIWVRTIALPTTTSGSNRALTMVPLGLDIIARSSDGRFLTVAGFDTGPNQDVGSSNSSTINRTIGLIKYDGTVNTTTALNDFSSQGFPNAAFTTDGVNIWCVGGGTGFNLSGNQTGGVRYTTLGSTTSIPLYDPSAPGNSVDIAGGQLYRSISSSLGAVGSGTPMTSGQTVTPLPGLPTSFSGLTQFAFLDLNPNVAGVDVLYLAETGNSLIRKYSLVGGSWTSNGSVGGGSDFYRGIAASVSGTTVTLYSTKVGSNAIGSGDIVKLVDASGYNGAISGTPTTIASITSIPGITTANTAAFRSVALVPVAPGSNVSAKIFLQGAYNSGLGRHKDVTSTWAAILNANALNQPFNTSAFGNYNGGESVSSGFFTSTGATTDIVDWVLVELRNSSTPSTVVARKAAFVREDGQVVGLDGSSAVSFTGVADGSYYLVVRHRNHLSVRSSSTIAVSSGATASYDFTTAQSKAFQDGTVTSNAAMKDLGSGVFGLWGGNVNANTRVSFQGLSNDYAALVALLGGNQATTINGYSFGDLNLDGVVKFSGLNNDAAVLLTVLGGNQAAVINQHQ